MVLWRCFNIIFNFEKYETNTHCFCQLNPWNGNKKAIAYATTENIHKVNLNLKVD